jgi:hypothetical protein
LLILEVIDRGLIFISKEIQFCLEINKSFIYFAFQSAFYGQ